MIRASAVLFGVAAVLLLTSEPGHGSLYQPEEPMIVPVREDGRAEAYGTVESVREAYGGHMVRLQYIGTLPEPRGWRVVTAERNYAELALEERTDDQAVLRTLLDAGVTVHRFDATTASMEQVFLSIYGHAPEEAAA